MSTYELETDQIYFMSEMIHDLGRFKNPFRVQRIRQLTNIYYTMQMQQETVDYLKGHELELMTQTPQPDQDQRIDHVGSLILHHKRVLRQIMMVHATESRIKNAGAIDCQIFDQQRGRLRVSESAYVVLHCEVLLLRIASFIA